MLTSSGRRVRVLPIRGFTLIELLVVISIIALLISIMLPSLRGAKAKGESAACLANMRSLGTALRGYFVDSEGTFPMNGLLMPKSGIPTMYMGNPRFLGAEERNQQKWRLEYGAIWTYMGGNSPDPTFVPTASNPLPYPNEITLKGFICQADWKNGRQRLLDSPLASTPAEGPLTFQPAANGGATVTVGPGQPGYWSYSVNACTNSLGRFRNNPAFANGVPWGDPLREINVRSQEQFIIFVEEDDKSKFNDEVFDAPAYNGGDLLTDRHDHNGNVSFLDGHAETYNAVIFNNQPSPSDGINIDNKVAMQSPVTRLFFPDFGNFAYP